MLVDDEGDAYAGGADLAGELYGGLQLRTLGGTGEIFSEMARFTPAWPRESSCASRDCRAVEAHAYPGRTCPTGSGAWIAGKRHHPCDPSRIPIRITVGCVPYEWLPTAFTVLTWHGIAAYEVLQVLSGRHRLPIPVRAPYGLALLNVLGRTNAGRLLAVTVRLGSGFDAQIVGAREMTDAEREEFLAWESSR